MYVLSRALNIKLNDLVNNKSFAAYLLFFVDMQIALQCLAAGSNSFCSLYMLTRLGGQFASWKQKLTLEMAKLGTLGKHACRPIT